MGRLVWDDKKATVAQITTQRNAKYHLGTHNMSNFDADGLHQQTRDHCYPVSQEQETEAIRNSHGLIETGSKDWKKNKHFLLWWVLIHWTPAASTATSSQSILSPLGCGGTGDSRHGWETEKFAAMFDAIVSIWTNISEECFQQLDDSITWIIKTVLKTKRGFSTGKVHLIKYPLIVFALTLSILYV